MRSLLLLIVGLALPAIGIAQAPAGLRIGVAGGVKGVVQVFAPSTKAVGRVLSSGQPLFLNEKIATGPSGSLQVMLIDETVFTIGPNSSLVLDDFVYDPASHSGKVSAKVEQGVFRFVTGQIGHKKPSDMKVKLPVGTMGIRGTMVAGEVTSAGTTAVLLGPGPASNASGERIGAFSLENEAGRVDVVRPGYATRVAAADQAPSRPATLPQAQLDGLLGSLAPSPRPAGGENPAPPEESYTHGAATEESGQATATAADNLSDTQSVADLVTGLSENENAALNTQADFDLETFLAANQSSWDDVRAIPAGTGQYAGTGDFFLGQCGGGSCADTNGPHGSMDFLFNVDFGAKTVGGAAFGAPSHVSVTASDASLPASVNETVTFPAQSFAALAGAASLTGQSPSGNLSAKVSILNFGGTAASAGAVAVYADPAGTVGSGAVLAPRLDCAAGGCH